MGIEQAPKNQEQFLQHIGNVLLGSESSPRGREAEVMEAFAVIQRDANLFATEMVKNRMPVDTAIHIVEAKRSVPRRFASDKVETTYQQTRYPMWIVLDEKDLSGGKLEVVKRHLKRHVGPDRTEEIDPQDFGNKPFENTIDSTYYDGKRRAIAVTPQGQIVNVRDSRKQKDGRADYPKSFYNGWKIVPGELAMPMDVFGKLGITHINLDLMVALMQSQFGSSAENYLNKKLTDTKNTADYFYEPQDFDRERAQWR